MAYKMKNFPFVPRSPYLARMMQSCIFILAANWVFQGMRGMQAKELSFRLSIELLAATVAFVILPISSLLLCGLVSLVIAHSLNFTINGQVWVCARYCRFYRQQPENLDAYLQRIAEKVMAKKWLNVAVCIGSQGQAKGSLSSRSDIDMRFVFADGFGGWLRTNLLLLRLRGDAFFRGIPLDLYAYDTVKAFDRFDQSEAILIMLDRNQAFRNRYCHRDLKQVPISPTKAQRICCAYSPGGHFTELERALSGVKLENRFDITFKTARNERYPDRKIYTIIHPRRSIFRTFANAIQATVIMLRERPEIIISTGADVTLPSLFIGKFLGAKIIFVETGGTLTPSLCGKLIYPYADLFVVQWPEKLQAFPNATLANGPLL